MGAVKERPVATDESPQQFGEYHLLEKIATGGMAEVWKARAFGMAGFEKTLVIKKVLDNLAQDDEFVRLFIDEARIAVALQHVNIVQVYDLGQAEGAYFMAMEYVHGLDLSRLRTSLREGEPFPVPLALFVVAEVLKALQFAHDRTDEAGKPLQVVHCDISPQNILLSFSGEVKITDFGISRAAFQAQGLQDAVRGKYAYMSPEQVDGRPLDGRSDLFSLGIVLWELLTGRRLFKARQREETLMRVRRAEVPSPRSYRADISEDLEGVVLKALARRPEHRYANAGKMLEAIGILMVREGHRATNRDLAEFIKRTMEASPLTEPGSGGGVRLVDLVVLSAEVVDTRGASDGEARARVADAWAASVHRTGGEVWEREGSSLLAVWTAESRLQETLSAALEAVAAMRESARSAGLRLAGGLAPGRARVFVDTSRPAQGWELTGPFYLARWMMNLSAHRRRVVLTRVAASALPEARTEHLGRISVMDERYIHLHELRDQAG